MVSIRGTAWFFALALLMACWMGALGSSRGVAWAGLISSHGTGGELRAAELAKLQEVLERKVVLQKLLDYGVSPREAMDKIRTLGDRDLHRLASLADRVPEGADSGADLVIGLAVLVILVLIILMLMHKRVIIR